MPRPLILCADDSPNILRAWKGLLEREGLRVRTADDGTEALQVFLSHPVDLVLLDYHMPRMNGDVAAAQMRAHKPDIPIALLSADEYVPESALQTVDAFISKGEPTTTFLQIVDNLLSLRRLLQPLAGSQSRPGRKAA